MRQLVLGLALVGCTFDEPAAIEEVHVIHTREQAPAWAVPYGQEFWRARASGLDVNDVIDRVSHAVDDNARVVSRTYTAHFDAAGLAFAPVRNDAALHVRTERVAIGDRDLYADGLRSLCHHRHRGR